MKDIRRYRYMDVDKLEDVWNHGSTLTIQSAFILRAVSQAPTKKNQDIYGLRTAPCGMGWNFQFLYYSNARGLAGGINIQLSPCLLQSSHVGQVGLDVKISCPQVDRPSLPTSTIQSMSFANGDCTLLSQWKPWGHPDYPVAIGAEYHIQISITFSEATTANFPKVTPVLSGHRPGEVMEEFFVETFSTGGDVVDLEFSLYTVRKSGSLTGASKIYGLSRLLKGRCDYLDALIDGNDFKSEGPLPETSPADEFCDYDSDFEDDVGKPMSSRDTDTTDVALKGSSDPEKDLSHRRVIPIKTFAFQTWKVLLNYLYTGTVTFRHISSHQLSKTQATQATSSWYDMSCSPKSMYRLADELDLGDLKARSFQAIKDGISTRNITAELDSKFTSMHNEILTFELGLLTAHELQKHLEKILEGTPAHERRVALKIAEMAFGTSSTAS